MKIAVNTRLLLHNRLDGIGWFTYESFKRIVEQHPEHEFHFLFDRKFSSEFVFADNVIPHVIPPQARHPWLYRIWYDYSVPYALKRIRPDVFISPDAMCSLRTQIPQLVVMHDLNFEHYPADLPKVYSNYLRKNSPLFATKAARIATVSESSKLDIIKQYQISPDKIDVVYNGVNESFLPLDDAAKQAVRNKWSGGKPFFVFVSSLHPRKNLQRLLPAFDNYKSQSSADTKLIVVGKKFWLNADIENAFDNLKYKEDVIFTGALPAEQLHSITASALASVYVSYFEGFGIPILEAFQCGVPVITSNLSSMPEVAGDAALLVDPFSVNQIAEALVNIADDAALRNQLIQKGLHRVKQFSWQKTADTLWKSMEMSTGVGR